MTKKLCRPNKILLTSLTASLVALQGCVPAMQTKSPEQLERERAFQQAMMERFLQANGIEQHQPQLQPQTAQAKPEPAAQMPDSIARFPSSAAPVKYEEFRDGFSINGQRILDPAGEIFSFSVNRQSGEFSYAVRTGANSFLIKYGSVTTPQRHILAQGQQNSGQITITTYNGHTLSGTAYIPKADGMLVLRGSAAFEFSLDSPVPNTLSLPAQFHIARLQPGDVSATGYILLEKDDAATQANNAFEAANELIEVTSLFFKDKAFDHYLLFNLKNGQQVPLKTGKYRNKVTEYSGCRQTNKLGGMLNKCDNMDYRDGLYEPKRGTRNHGHYFWSLNWFMTPQGPVAVENAGKSFNIYTLNDGKRYEAFHRTLGIHSFTLQSHPDGRYSVAARLGLSTKKIDDINQWLQQQTNVQAAAQ